MLVNRVVIAIIILTLAGIACEAPDLESAKEPKNTQPNNPPTSKPQTSNGSGRLTGCDSLPEDLPFLEDAFEASDYQGWCSYKTNNDYQSAVDFYRTQLSANGWEEFRTIQNDQNSTTETHFYYDKSGRKVAIGIIHTSELVIVTIYPEYWVDQPCDNGGTGLPTPDDIPIIGNMIGRCYEQYGWSDSGEGNYDYFYITLENFNDTLQFYRSEPINSGWSLDSEYTGDTVIELHFKKPGRVGTVQSGLNNFIQAPLDFMKVSILGPDKYGDTEVHIYVISEN